MDAPRRQPIGQALQHIQTWLSGSERDFTRWCDEVHHAEALEVDGFLACRRFELVPGYAYAAPGGAQFLTVYQVADEHSIDTDSHRAHGAAMTPAPPGVMEALTYTRTIYRERRPDGGRVDGGRADGGRPDGGRPDGGWPDGGWMAPGGVIHTGDEPIGGAVLHVMMDVDPSWDAELNAWYAEEHLPRLLEVPGMLAARRFADVHWPSAGVSAAKGRHQYLAVYELEDADVVTTAEFAHAAEMTPRTAELAPHLTFISQIYREVFAQDA